MEQETNPFLGQAWKTSPFVKKQLGIGRVLIAGFLDMKLNFILNVIVAKLNKSIASCDVSVPQIR